MSVDDQVRGLRSSVGVSRADHVVVLHVEGPDAFDVLEHASTRRLYLREGQVRHTLLLRDDASVLADVAIGSGDDGFYVFAEGRAEVELVTWFEALRDRFRPGARVTFRGLSDERVVVGVDGPFAWELLAGVIGPGVLGMPYMTLLRREDILCLRSGKTGEYGYVLLCPRSAVEALEKRIAEAGQPLDLVGVGLEALDVCALENGHFSMHAYRTVGRDATLTPLELQLQWRVAYDKEFVGAEALRVRRASGLRLRTTTFTAGAPLAAGQLLRRDDGAAGEVLASVWSPTLGTWVGVALLERRLAHPHVPLVAATEAGRVEIVTHTTPLVDNRSLHVDLHKDTYATYGAGP